jgi:hypothetical protein
MQAAEVADAIDAVRRGDAPPPPAGSADAIAALLQAAVGICTLNQVDP